MFKFLIIAVHCVLLFCNVMLYKILCSVLVLLNDLHSFLQNYSIILDKKCNDGVLQKMALFKGRKILSNWWKSKPVKLNMPLNHSSILRLSYGYVMGIWFLPWTHPNRYYCPSWLQIVAVVKTVFPCHLHYRSFYFFGMRFFLLEIKAPITNF